VLRLNVHIVAKRLLQILCAEEQDAQDVIENSKTL
jgi:hypothetical protein